MDADNPKRIGNAKIEEGVLFVEVIILINLCSLILMDLLYQREINHNFASDTYLTFNFNNTIHPRYQILTKHKS